VISSSSDDGFAGNLINQLNSSLEFLLLDGYETAIFKFTYHYNKKQGLNEILIKFPPDKAVSTSSPRYYCMVSDMTDLENN
jgi:hypothetical protein